MSDKNGYNDSLLNTQYGTCYLTGQQGDTVRHEIFQASNRANSKHDGLWINISVDAHKKWHEGKSERTKEITQRKAEILWLRADWNRSINDFVERYGKNYL